MDTNDIEKARLIRDQLGCLSVTLLQSKLRIKTEDARQIILHLEPDHQFSDQYNTTLTKDQRYYRKHKQVKDKKPRTYHFQTYWAEEWEKATRGI